MSLIVPIVPDGDDGKKRPRILAGVPLAVFIADPDFPFEIQRAPDSGGLPDVANAEIIGEYSGGPRWVIDVQVPDGLSRWYRGRHVREQYTPSSWTDWIEAVPALLPDVLPPVETYGRAFILRSGVDIKQIGISPNVEIEVTVDDWGPNTAKVNIYMRRGTDPTADNWPTLDGKRQSKVDPQYFKGPLEGTDTSITDGGIAGQYANGDIIYVIAQAIDFQGRPGTATTARSMLGPQTTVFAEAATEAAFGPPTGLEVEQV